MDAVETVDPVLTVPEVAALFRCSTQNVYALAGRAFPAIRLGRSVRVRKSVALAYLDSRESGPTDTDTPGELAS